MRPRAPAGDGEALAVPPLSDVGDLIARNRPFDAELRAAARSQVMAAARAYHAERREPMPDSDGDVWLVSGHQPELFHPGVWVKNFALTGLARQYRAVALSLIVDNDTVKAASVRVPTGERIAFDRFSGEQPWEERPVIEPRTFAAFPERVAEVMGRWGVEPLARRLWENMPADGTLGERFAAGRRAVERDWGCHNLEVPLSRVCDTPAFAEFVGRIVHDAPRFVEVYNAAVANYRRRNKIKSHNHPVPDLARDGEWLELPLWAWPAGASRRERVFVRRGEIRPAGMKVRSRALLTTLFARLCLADVFLHGLGGGLYDRLTDDIVRRFFGVEPPGFVTLTATCLLPLPVSGATDEQRRRLHRHLRDLEFQPERFLDGQMADLVAQRQAVLAGPPSRQAFARQRELLARINAPLADERERTRRELAEVEARLTADARLRRRDYSLCLYPESKLRPFLTAWL
jgi:hypothetical protein